MGTVVDLDDIEAALIPLVRHKVVARFDGARPVYGIETGAELEAAYYRNSIIHYFVGAAICELALLAVAERDASSDPLQVFRQQVSVFRDLLKFDFFFPEKVQFEHEIDAEMARHDAAWLARIGGSRDEVEAFVRSFRPLSSHLVLRPYLEAYAIVGGTLARCGSGAVTDDELLRQSQANGRQFLAQHLAQSGESISQLILKNGIKAARGRLLVESSANGLDDQRRAWSIELQDILIRVRRVGGWASDQYDEVTAPEDRVRLGGRR